MKKYLLLLILSITVACASPGVEETGQVENSQASEGSEESLQATSESEEEIEQEESEEETSPEQVEDEGPRENSNTNLYEDLSFLDFYWEILEGVRPYKTTYSEYSSSNVDQYLDDLYGSEKVRFALFDHPDFAYPLLILSSTVGSEDLYAIVQYMGDGKFETFSDLDPSELSIFSNHIYQQDGQKLFIDNVDDEIIYEINPVDGKLKVNYAYTEGSKGFASAHRALETGPVIMSDLENEYLSGSDGLYAITILDDLKESFNKEEFDELYSSLEPIEMYDISEENFYRLAEKIGASQSVKETSEASTDVYRDYYELIVNGQDVGSLEVLRNEEIFLLDVADMNKKLMENWKYEEDHAREMLEYITDFSKENPDGSIYFGAFPYSMEFAFLYHPLHRAVSIAYFAFEEEDEVYLMNANEYDPIVDNGKLYMDLFSLDILFGLDSQLDDSQKQIRIDQNGKDTSGNLIAVSTSQYSSLEDILNDYCLRREPDKVNIKSVEEFESDRGHDPENNEGKDPIEPDPKLEENEIEDETDKEINSSEEATENAEKSDKESEEKREEEKKKDSVIKIKPELRISPNSSATKWQDIDYIHLEVKNREDYPKGTKIIIESPDLIISKDKLSGFDIDDQYINIDLANKWYNRKGKNKSQEKPLDIKVKLIYNDVESEKYQIYYSSLLEDVIEKILGKYPDKYFADLKSNLGSLEEYKPVKNGNYQYQYIQASMKETDRKNKLKSELAGEWFFYANDIQLKGLIETTDFAKNNKVNEKHLNVLGKVNPIIAEKDVAAGIAKNIKGYEKTIPFQFVPNAEDYYGVFTVTGSAGARLTTGSVWKKGKDGKDDSLVMRDLIATPRTDKNFDVYGDKFLHTIGFQAIAGVTGTENLVSWATNTKEDKYLDIAKLTLKLYAFTDPIENKLGLSKKDKKSFYEMMDLYKDGVSLFELSQSLDKLNKSGLKNNESYNSDLTVDEINDLIDASIKVSKYLNID